MAWVGRDPKDHQVPIPLPQAGLTSTRSSTRSGWPGPIQPGLEHLQGQGIRNLSGQPVPEPCHSPSKKLPPNIQPKSSLLQLKTISPYPAVIYPGKDCSG